MMSYLANRHYWRLTEGLPRAVRRSMPEAVYHRTHCHNGKGDNQGSQPGQQISKYNDISNHTKHFEGDRCPICGTQDQIVVLHYSRKHICVQCRNLLRDQHGNQVRIFLDHTQNIVCLGLLPQSPQGKATYYTTNHMKLSINNGTAYASFADVDELVLLLNDNFAAPFHDSSTTIAAYPTQ